MEDQKQLQKPTVSFRVTQDLYDFYVELAARERRTLTDVLRISLEDRAEELKKAAGSGQATLVA